LQMSQSNIFVVTVGLFNYFSLFHHSPYFSFFIFLSFFLLLSHLTHPFHALLQILVAFELRFFFFSFVSSFLFLFFHFLFLEIKCFFVLFLYFCFFIVDLKFEERWQITLFSNENTIECITKNSLSIYLSSE
jgi:hypothetical protein